MISKFRALKDAARWQFAKLTRSRDSGDALISKTISLGEWLRSCDYTGIDVSVSYPPRKISTTLAFAMVGWGKLACHTRDKSYYDYADYCLSELVRTQTVEGCWLFPYPFRNNAADFAYSCENFMTVECLMDYWGVMGKPQIILDSVDKALNYLLNHIGYESGVFWYSSSDKIYVPNISSMATRVFSSASNMFGNLKYFELSKEFANYCISQQATNGAYPYFEDSSMVYIPYHALEIWELAEANKELKDPRISASLDRAIDYLRNFIKNNGYVSKDPMTSKQILMKTPVWASKAFLSTGFNAEARMHLNNGLKLFQIPGTEHYFYILRHVKGITVPVFNTCYMRYNSSAFEIQASLICKHKNTRE